MAKRVEVPDWETLLAHVREEPSSGSSICE
jgi:hypothetical protein